MNDQLTTELIAADPVGSADDTRVHALVAQMSERARAEAATGRSQRKPWWKRGKVLVPLGFLGAAALTGGAILIPLNLSIDGVPVEADAVIPIAYTTDTGVDISCRYAIFIGEPDTRDAATEELAAFMAEHDWSGIGQRAYDEAIANPIVPGLETSAETAEEIDRASFMRAVGREITSEIPADLEGPLHRTDTDSISSAVTSCQGVLH